MSSEDDFKRFLKLGQAMQRDVDRLTNYDHFSSLLLTLGSVTASLKREDVREKLVETLRLGKLRPDYLVLLRRMLAEVLIESGYYDSPSKFDTMRGLLEHLLLADFADERQRFIWREHIKAALAEPDTEKREHELSDEMIAKAYKSVYGSALGLEEDPLLGAYARAIAGMLVVPREPKP